MHQESAADDGQLPRFTEISRPADSGHRGVRHTIEIGADFHYIVHNAAGMVSVQLGNSVAEALIRLRAVACQMIALHPDGGGAYAVGKANLGTTVSLLAAASLASAFPLLANCW